jgi:hypothetical protein
MLDFLIAAALQAAPMVRPAVEIGPAPGSRLIACPAWITTRLQSPAPPTCMSGTMRRSQEQQNAYQASLIAQGWLFKDGAANAMTYERACETLTFAGFPLEEPKSSKDFATAKDMVFIFSMEPKRNC